MGNTKGTTIHGGTDALPDLATAAVEAERLGAGALWACDHLYWSGPTVECLTAVTVAATLTHRVPVGTCVLQLPLRHAPAVAKQAASLQQLSGGRLVLGVGVGSHKGEYRAAGVEFTGRGLAMEHGIAQLRQAWASADDDGAYRQLPAPAAVPVFVGGGTRTALKRAARVGDGWIPMFLPPDTYRCLLDELAEEVAEHGRPEGAVEAATVVFVRTGTGRDAARAHAAGADWLSSLYAIPPKAFSKHLVAGSPAQCAAGVQAYLDAGARHVAVMVADDDALAHFDALLGALELGSPGGHDGATTAAHQIPSNQERLPGQSEMAGAAR